MVARSLMGTAVRRLRRERGLTQAELAASAGISTSYLNLIEHNRRPLTDAVGLALARAMELDPHEISSGEDARVLASLSEALRDPLFREAAPPIEDVAALANVPRSIGQAFLTLHRAYRTAREEARLLTERLASETLANAPAAEMRGLVASIRSFGEIVHDHADLRHDERQRFMDILVRDAEQLTELLDRLHAESDPSEDVADSLEADQAGQLAGPGDPAEFLEGRNNYFQALEEAANSAREELLGGSAGRPDAPLFDPLARLLASRHGTVVEIVADEPASGRVWSYDDDARRLCVSEWLPAEIRTFLAARRLAFASSGRILDRCLEQAPRPTPEQYEISRDAAADYFARAVMMPYGAFRAAAEELRYDIERLGRRFGVGFEHACHRLTTLRRPGEAGIAFHMVRIDIAGNVTFRFNGSGLRIARYGGICPRWNVHSAFLTPGRVQTQVAETPEGGTWLCIARTVEEPATVSGRHRSPAAIGLGCDAAAARRIAYADGLDLAAGPRVPIGINCRLCSRNDCGQRVFRALDLAVTGRFARRD